MKNTVSGFLALLLTAVLLVSPVFAENDLINDIPPTNEYYIWMGMEGDSPIKWHIIGATGYEYLLMSADLIGSKMNWSDAMDFVRYEAIYEYFSEAEQNAILWTNKFADDDYHYGSSAGRPDDVSDKLFLLSLGEVDTYLPSSDLRTPVDWWMRSRAYRIDDYATLLSRNSSIVSKYIYSRDKEDHHHVRPAFQLDRNSVFLESAAVGGKSTTLPGGGSFGMISGPSGSGKNEVKLTLIDNNRNSGRYQFSADIAGSREAAIVPGGTITVNYRGAAKGDHISARLCQGSTMYYATTQQRSDGKWTLTLPDSLQGDYTLKVFSEQQCGDKKTDYASPVTDLGLYTPITVTYKVVNGVWSDGSTGDKTEMVAFEQKPAAVPTGMTASEGYTGGAWDSDPAAATIKKATTFTYSFESKKHTVTVAGGTADRTETVAGESITITADAPEAGQRFKGWSGAEGLNFTEGSASTATATFLMPARSVELTAVWQEVYPVTVTGGTADKAGAVEGESVTVTADAPGADRRFREWTGAEGLTFTDGDAASAAATFTMPAHAAELTATYDEVYPVTVTGGTADKAGAIEGESVTVTADEPEYGWRFKEWAGAEGLTFTEGDAASATAAFSMPGRAAELTAVYEELPKATVTIEFGEGHGDFAEARFGCMDGFTVNGTTLTYSVYTIMTVGSARDVFDDVSGIPGEDDGEHYGGNLALNPADRYGSLSEVNAERAAWDDQPVPPEGITFYVQWSKPVGDVTVTVTPPAAGTEITVSGSEPMRRTEPQVEAAVTGNAEFDRYSGANWANDDYRGYYSGTVAGGQDCFARFYLIAKYGYYFPFSEDETGLVLGEGASVTVTNASETILSYAGTGDVLKVCATVTAAGGAPGEAGSVFGGRPGIIAGAAAGVLVLAGAAFAIVRHRKKKGTEA
ncbi:MAG: hypothetical protein IK082_05325 [Oscillospiraceae bacterium]|nr:hypothetical protein [Oscillospiraceae bacterium]